MKRAETAHVTKSKARFFLLLFSFLLHISRSQFPFNPCTQNKKELHIKSSSTIAREGVRERGGKSSSEYLRAFDLKAFILHGTGTKSLYDDKKINFKSLPFCMHKMK
jgi:hypothetical protein